MSDVSEEENFSMYAPVKDSLAKCLENIERHYKNDYANPEQFVQTGIRDLLLPRGGLVVLAARPGYGNFSCAVSLVKNLAVDKKKPVGVFACGCHDSVNFCEKLISIEAGISPRKFCVGELELKEFEKIQAAGERVYGAPIFINDSPNVCFAGFEFAARLMVEQKKVEAIFLDSLEYFSEIANAPKDDYAYDTSFLHDEEAENDVYGHYLGSFTPKGAK